MANTSVDMDFLSKPSVAMAGAIILPNIGGWVGGIITKNNIKSWYEGLKVRFAEKIKRISLINFRFF